MPQPKKLIERAYTEGESSGIAVWTEDEAGPTPDGAISWSELAANRRTQTKASRVRASGDGQAGS